MTINISLLEHYFKKNGTTINTNIDIDDNDAFLKFILGDSREGDRVEFVSFKMLEEILIVNNILGGRELLIQERDALSADLRAGLGWSKKREAKMESLVYDTLARYIIQIFFLNSGKKLFPELILLPIHKDMYFIED